MQVAVVILNWNGKSLLAEFLPSVVAFSDDANIYVADNASTDDSITFLNKEFPSVKIIQNATNGGYAKGYNDALQHLDEELFVLLNSDVAVTENWLQPILMHFGNNPDTAIAQPKILDYKKKNYFEYAGAAGGFIDKLGYPFCRGRIFDVLEEDFGQYDDNQQILWASGACFVIRKTVFFELGKFDEDYFAHQEEIDLCWRSHNAGYKAFCIGESKAFHLGGGTLNAMSPQKTFLNFRNSLFSLLKNVSGSKVWILLFVRLSLDGIAAILFLFQVKPQHTFAVLKSHFSFYWFLPKMLRKRKKIAQTKAYAKIGSVVFSYFIQKKKSYTQL